MSQPDQHFGGTIGTTIAESVPEFSEPPHPGQDAPNVVVIVLDDTGFAQLGCYGSDIDTAHIDQLAGNGLQFTNFHVTPLCSPTRAALLTGRSQHAVGMRAVSNFRTGFPHQLGHITDRAATIAEVLHTAGYATFAAGKWHLAPMEQCSAAGPFDQWPLARGFDRFYGFLDGETDQFSPELVCDNHMVDPPARPEEGYHLSEDLVDRLLAMITDSTSVRPDRPFFAYLPFGAAHAPHQAPAAYLRKYRGAFDEGWDIARERVYRRQLETGLIPAGTALAPRNPGVAAWDTLPADQQRLACRLQEAFAAFLDHTDDQIGRFVDGLRRIGVWDNTVLILLSDNGASQEGGPIGVLHEMKFFNGILEDPADAVARLDDIGGPHSHTNYPWGWAQCGNTPFKWYKQNTHEGGVHVPMLVHWPAGIDQHHRGSRRDQFVNVSDIAPTLYELAGVTPPPIYRGIPQLPVTGHSFAALLNNPAAPSTNTVQYFEMAGSRALVAGHWKAVCKHIPGADYDTEPWELYDLSHDMSECEDLAGAEPERLAELIALWWLEADRHGVLPLDDRGIELFAPRFRHHSPHPVEGRYTYRPPCSPIPPQAFAPIGGTSFDLTARVARADGQDGVLWATGTENSGIAVFVQDDHLVVDYNAFGEHTVVISTRALAAGDAVLTARFRRGDHRGGTVDLEIDSVPVGHADLPLYMLMISSVGSSIGYDHGSAVSDRYRSPFAFRGILHEITVDLVSSPPTGSDAVASRAAMARQ
ncbi:MULTISPECIES: arylsulfatase [Mycobacteriaceae]|uniref:Arylsulfatase n=1 Tax=Mycolicibacterium neoaurum VKM Ac-1815D TaxID=700508 RepID=V5XF75_MYCNE|nr:MULTISPECIES: arylsulfatase [Mycobacteriaceae]AHC26039.1 sulfatase [Mycolicibacterium neoaurum VKM Ac-1815D]AMO06424.1 sulfatase [Mycolicibacterium neoaurum]AXK75228.1 arylsulfatase [Mycolicibacterium neoaurum]KJQ51094.1 sulfatase [Mycolicibacterium neoaurum]KUM08011.1 sulfatase [Mycolicibacterium neoaurum]